MTTSSYTIECNDTETTPAWQALCSTLKPSQEGERCVYQVTLPEEQALKRQGMLDADDDVVAYEWLGDSEDEVAKTVTDKQIQALETEAFAHGDALMGYVCRVALGADYTVAQLIENTCLNREEREEVEAMTHDEARARCARAIRNGQGD